MVVHRASPCVWCDLERDRVFELDQGWVHDSESRMLAHRRLRRLDGPPSVTASFAGGSAATVRVEVGASLVWDDVPWTVLNRGPDTATFRCEDGSGRVVPLSMGNVERLLQDGALRGADTTPDLVAVFRRASALDYARARWETVTYLKTHGWPPPSATARCVRRYSRWCKDGERRYGSAFAGLARFRGLRRGTSALGASQAEVLREGVEAFADDRRAGRVQAAYARLVALCNERNVHPPPSDRTLRRALAKASRPDPSAPGAAAGPPARSKDRPLPVDHSSRPTATACSRSGTSTIRPSTSGSSPA